MDLTAGMITKFALMKLESKGYYRIAVADYFDKLLKSK